MLNKEKINRIAEAVGMGDQARAIFAAMEVVEARPMLHVAFVGGQNSGKTALINAAIERMVRESSNLSVDDELPLRITFEKTEEDDRFECIEVFSPVWSGENAVLFEMKSAELVVDGKPTALANEIDVVFFLISAMNAFTAEDVSTLRALPCHKIKPVLTKLDAIDEEHKAGVLKYASDMCEKLDLEKPIILDKSNHKDAGKLIRDALPLYAEQQELRQQLCNYLGNSLVLELREQLEKRTFTLDGESAVAEDMEFERAIHIRAMKTRNELIQLGTARCQKYADTQSLAQALARKLHDSGKAASYSNDWKASVCQTIIEPAIIAEFEEEKAVLQKLLLEDCGGINPTAEETKRLKRRIEEATQVHAQIYDMEDSGALMRDSQSSINAKTVGITAAVVAGALLLPIPPIAACVISVGAIALGTNAVVTEKRKTEIENWDKKIKDYSAFIAERFYEGMVIYYNGAYDKLADYVYNTIMAEAAEKTEIRKQSVIAEKERYIKMLDELK